MKRQSRVKVKSLTIYFVIIIATSATVGITIYFEDNIKESIPAIASLAAAGSIGVFSYYLQSGGEKKRSDMLYQINKISKEQERANLAMAREPLIRISKEIFDLSNEFEEYLTKVKESIKSKQYDLNLLKECKEQMKPKVENKLKIIDKAANENRIFIGDIYHEIFTAIRDLRETVDSLKNSYDNDELDSSKEIIEEWKDICEEAVHESKVLSDHIDYFFFVPLDPKDFENAKFSNILRSRILKSSVTIIIGSKGGEDTPTDSNQAKNLKKEITEKFRLNVQIENDRKIKTDEDLLRGNLIVIGGPRINSVTRDLRNRFPLQYLQTIDSDNTVQDNIYSRISRKIYPGSEYAAIQIMINPYREDDKKSIIVAFGSDKDGTEYAIKLLIAKIKDIISENELQNLLGHYYPAKVIRIVKNEENRLHKNDRSYVRIDYREEDDEQIRPYICRLEE